MHTNRVVVKYKGEFTVNVKNKNIIRWILLLPTLVVVWVIATVISLLIMLLFYSRGYEDMFIDVFMYAFLFLMYIVLPFFVMRWIAPKYKTFVGIVMTIIMCIIQIYVMYEL